jgi:hypothetical protein
MRIPMNSVALATLCLIINSGFCSASEPACATRADLVGPCFDLAGRLRLYNGTPSARIVQKYTHRVLGVKPYFMNNNETFVAPESLRNVVAFGKALNGAFLVCPLTKREPHKMQTVCIESLSKSSPK